MYTFIRSQAGVLSTQRLCKLLKVSRSGYYQWRLAIPSLRKLANQSLDQHISRLYIEAQGFIGYRGLRALLAEQGIKASYNRIRRRMRQLGIMGRQFKRKRTTTNSQHLLGYAPNLLSRQFQETAPNRTWVGDMTYIRAGHRWVYLATVLDLFSRKVVGWAMAQCMKAKLVCEAFEMAMLHRGQPKQVIFHSDRGVQYAAAEFRLQLALTQTRQSMSGKGSCYDNAVAESFFKTLKTECANRSFSSFEEAKATIFAYIETRYNQVRPHSFNDYLSPNKKERLYYQSISHKT